MSRILEAGIRGGRYCRHVRRAVLLAAGKRRNQDQACRKHEKQTDMTSVQCYLPRRSGIADGNKCSESSLLSGGGGVNGASQTRKTHGCVPAPAAPQRAIPVRQGDDGDTRRGIRGEGGSRISERGSKCYRVRNKSASGNTEGDGLGQDGESEAPEGLGQEHIPVEFNPDRFQELEL